MAPYCPCGYEDVNRGKRFTSKWHRAHRDHHLAVFPEVDQQTRDALAQCIVLAEQEGR